MIKGIIGEKETVRRKIKVQSKYHDCIGKSQCEGSQQSYISAESNAKLFSLVV